MVRAVEKHPALHPGLCSVRKYLLDSWSGDATGREECEPAPRDAPWQDCHRSTQVVGHAVPSPEFVAELRSGYWAVAIGMSRHQLPGMPMGEAQLPFEMSVTGRSWVSLEQALP